MIWKFLIFIDFSRLNCTLTDIKELTFQKIKKLENNPHLEGEKVLALAEISKKKDAPKQLYKATTKILHILKEINFLLLKR